MWYLGDKLKKKLFIKFLGFFINKILCILFYVEYRTPEKHKIKGCICTLPSTSNAWQ